MCRYYEKSIIEQEILEMRKGKDSFTWEETKHNIREARYRLSLRTESFISQNGNIPSTIKEPGSNDKYDDAYYTFIPPPSKPVPAEADNGGAANGDCELGEDNDGGVVDDANYLSAAKLFDDESSSLKLMSP